MTIRGVRGATVAIENSAQAILTATKDLLIAISEANPGLKSTDIASVFFTVTDDLTQAYPAMAARQMGWTLVPLMCAREIPVVDSLSKCIRVLILWNTDLSQTDIHHIYLGDAKSLRPDFPG